MPPKEHIFEFPDDRPIVVVDDDPGERHVLRYVLQQSRLLNEVVFLASTAQLLSHMNAVAAGQLPLPVLILMDINMPGASGFVALAGVRACPAFSKRPLIAMLTSSDAEEDRARSEQLGANDYLAKQSGIDAYASMLDSRFRNCA